jgi:hypothetical protein
LYDPFRHGSRTGFYASPSPSALRRVS